MTQKYNYTKNKIYLIIPVAVAIITAATLTAISAHNNVQASPSPKPNATLKQSKFSFDQTKATAWRQGPSNSTSLALFAKDQSCFVSLEYKTGVVDESAEMVKTQTGLAKGGYTSTPTNLVSATLDSTSSTQPYKLQQYKVTGSGNAGSLYGGQEFSYITQSNGYVFVQGNCNTADQLATTISALQAVKFDVTK